MEEQTGEKTYTHIAVHERPHLDEIAAIWSLRRFGREQFPGVDKADIVFWRTGGETPEALADVCQSEGILAIGTGWGPFDEHPSPTQAGRSGECAATLVAKALGVDDDPTLEPILRFVLNSDTKGSSNPFDLAALVKTMHEQYSDDPMGVMAWAMQALEAKYLEQQQFLVDTANEFHEKARVDRVAGPRGQITMVVVCSDNEKMNKFARSSHGARADIVIQQWPTGNVQIFVNKRARLTLYDVAQMIRLAEQEKKGKVVTSDWKQLAAEGKVEGAEEWYFHVGLMALMNGSLTAKGVPPTHLSLEEIRIMVKIGVDPSAFEPARASDCQRGKCTASSSNPCPWHKWGLHRCREIRYRVRK